MKRQFPKLSCARGAPMGRHSAPDLDTSPRSVRLFKVNIDSGGYDDGGAYWGLRPHGSSLWCAMDSDGDMQFTDASSRTRAAMLLNIPAPSLRVGFSWRTLQADMIDGRCPKPPGMDADDVQAYFQLCQVVEQEARA